MKYEARIITVLRSDDLEKIQNAIELSRLGTAQYRMRQDKVKIEESYSDIKDNDAPEHTNL